MLKGYYGVISHLLCDSVMKSYDVYVGFCPLEFMGLGQNLNVLVEYDNVNIKTNLLVVNLKEN